MKKLGLGVLGLVTVVLLQTMEETVGRGAPVKMAGVLERHGLADLVKTT